jgi:hypothetical protein
VLRLLLTLLFLFNKGLEEAFPSPQLAHRRRFFGFFHSVLSVALSLSPSFALSSRFSFSLAFLNAVLSALSTSFALLPRCCSSLASCSCSSAIASFFDRPRLRHADSRA